MKRDYTNATDATPVFFTGVEVEKTPAYGLPTLFIVGLQDVETIASHLSGQTHLFFGANHSYSPKNNVEADQWEKMISYFLTKGYLCSLDIPISEVEQFNDGGLNEYTNFIPQIRVPIAYTKLWNYNTMVKIDDIGFAKTNPGVWTHSLHSLMDRNTFTSWTDYQNDRAL